MFCGLHHIFMLIVFLSDGLDIVWTVGGILTYFTFQGMKLDFRVVNLRQVLQVSLTFLSENNSD